MSRRNLTQLEIDLNIHLLESLPIDTVFEIGGHIYQKTLIALDSMPATRFRYGCLETGQESDKWNYAMKLLRKGWGLTIYAPQKEDAL